MSANPEQIREQRQREHQQNIRQSALQSAMAEAEDGNVELLREMIETKCHPGTVRALDNYMSPDFLLSKMSEADLTEFKHLLRIQLKMVYQAHPGQESDLGGQVRAIYYDDQDADLPVLNDEQRAILQAYADAIYWRAKRSDDGFQQEKWNENVNVAVSRDETSDDDGGGRLGGLF